MTVTNTRREPSDFTELLARAQAGEAEAFSALAAMSEERLFKQAVALCGNLALAEDLAAETLIEAWRSLSRFNGSCRFSTWLYAILVHRYQKSVRRARARPFTIPFLSKQEDAEQGMPLEQMADPSPVPGQELVQQELTRDLRKAIASLPRRHQQVVWLRFYEQASLPEIAAALDLSVGTVKSRLHHALEKLRRMPSILNLCRSLEDK